MLEIAPVKTTTVAITPNRPTPWWVKLYSKVYIAFPVAMAVWMLAWAVLGGAQVMRIASYSPGFIMWTAFAWAPLAVAHFIWNGAVMKHHEQTLAGGVEAFQDCMQQAVTDLTNQIREDHGLPPVEQRATLN